MRQQRVFAASILGLALIVSLGVATLGNGATASTGVLALSQSEPDSSTMGSCGMASSGSCAMEGGDTGGCAMGESESQPAAAASTDAASSGCPFGGKDAAVTSQADCANCPNGDPGKCAVCATGEGTPDAATDDTKPAEEAAPKSKAEATTL